MWRVWWLVRWRCETGAAVSRPAPRRRWAGAGNVLLVVLVTALQLTGPRAGSPVQGPVLLPGVAGLVVAAAAALIGGVALLWRRSRPVSVLVVGVAAYGVNAVMVPGVPPYAGWFAVYAVGVYGRPAGRAIYAAVAGAAALVAVVAACALIYPKTVGELVLLVAVTAITAWRGSWCGLGGLSWLRCAIAPRRWNANGPPPRPGRPRRSGCGSPVTCMTWSATG
jgi:hypothetical protein